MSRFNAQKCYSDLCQRGFDSKAEMRRGEELYLMEKAGEIKDLEFQVRQDLCDIKHYKCHITIDFRYKINGEVLYEDAKGTRFTKIHGKPRAFVDRDFRTKLAWLKDKYGIEVILTKDK